MRTHIVIPTAIASFLSGLFISVFLLKSIGVPQADLHGTTYWVQFALMMTFSIFVSYLATNAVEGNLGIAFGNIGRFILAPVMLLGLVAGFYYLWSAVPVWAFFIILLLALILVFMALIWINLAAKG
ncbi:MAG: hypothetical protein KAG82_12805 [Alcanivoracaceae bacterium]|nr:hypothetical protein [Alcanivoracaceae bacterium]